MVSSISQSVPLMSISTHTTSCRRNFKLICENNLVIQVTRSSLTLEWEFSSTFVRMELFIPETVVVQTVEIEEAVLMNVKTSRHIAFLFYLRRQLRLTKCWQKVSKVL
mmetsp:Transcript_4996/g.13948  ORF Transcript_4996/g.13948 Transcript_4996/m.13948 type:complete len:108 (-) Transcript_4996:625-948(-)